MVKGKDAEMQELVDMIQEKDRIIKDMQGDLGDLEDECARKQRENEHRKRQMMMQQDEQKIVPPYIDR